MSITQISTDDQIPTLNPATCPRCGTQLPSGAVFCNACGERLDKAKDLSSLLANEEDISSRYRMTSLVRRRPYVTLYFAQHISQPRQAGQPEQLGQSGQSRTVALRDIDLTSLDESAYRHALESVQREYDLLRRLRIPHILPVVDLRSYAKHLYTIAVPPGAVGAEQAELQGTAPIVGEQYLSTLQDFLQSGLGLPSEQRVLQWMDALCTAVDALHSKGIVIGDLDPYAILLLSHSGNAGDVRPLLMVSWLPPALREMLPQTTTATLSYFIAPESIQDAPDARSDVYSLGAILYLLLTGTTPGDSTRRGRSRLRPPQEINTRVSHAVSECVMQALAVNPSERFSSATAFAAALRNPRFRRLSSRGETNAAATATQAAQATQTTAQADAQAESETVRIIPLSRADLARWRAARSKIATQAPVQTPAEASTPGSTPAPTQVPIHTSIPPRPVTPRPPLLDDEVQAVESDWELSRSPVSSSSSGDGGSFVPSLSPVRDAESPLAGQTEQAGPVAQAETRKETAEANEEEAGETEPPTLPLPSGGASSASSASERPSRRTMGVAAGWKKLVTGLIPAFLSSRAQPKQTQVGQPEQEKQEEQVWTAEPSGAVEAEPAPALEQVGIPRSWWERFKQMVLGQQQTALAAAAIIETPLRVLPDQLYTLRINILGREEPAADTPGREEGRALGLSGLAHGDTVLIEVRSVLQQSYAYIVQKATVSVPAEGYVAEVVIPMQPLSTTPIGRRDRLHIYFLNEHHHPLYERPFAVEVFVSHHVKRGEEGHYILTIPY